MSRDYVTIVSGLPRSGTSMMMKMLEAGGMAVLTDNVRTADEDNPKGYYEFERVKKIETDTAWLPEARGKVVKMISALVRHLPGDHRYRVIFMRRNIDEVLASQRQMLARRGKPTDAVSDQKMAESFAKHVGQVEAWIAAQPNVEVLYVSYNDMVEDPAPHAARIVAFLGGPLDTEKMTSVVTGDLYRQRR
jgi:LPS sulfotransferase NodH